MAEKKSHQLRKGRRGLAGHYYHLTTATRDREPVFRDLHPARQLITFVGDRPGHDRGYWLPLEETRVALGWRPLVSLEEGLRKLVFQRCQGSFGLQGPVSE